MSTGTQKLIEAINASERLHDILKDQYKDYAQKAHALSNEFQKLREESVKNTYNIGVFASYSAGKTTLLKTSFFDFGLANIDLPMEQVITTQVPTFLKLNPIPKENTPKEPTASITYFNSDEFLEVINWKVEKLAKKYQANLTPINDKEQIKDWLEKTVLPKLQQYMQPNAFDDMKKDVLNMSTLMQEQERQTSTAHVAMETDIDKALSTIKDKDSSQRVKAVTIYLDAPGLKHHVSLTDLPGIDAPLSSAHLFYTYNFIETQANAAIFIKSVDKPNLTELEDDLLGHIQKHLVDKWDTSSEIPSEFKEFFLVYNKYHDLDVTEATKAEILNVARKVNIQDTHVFKVSALLALFDQQVQDSSDPTSIKEYYAGKGYRPSWAQYEKLKKEHGEQLIKFVGISDLKHALWEFCQKTLPELTQTRRMNTLRGILSGMESNLDHAKLSQEDIDKGIPVELQRYKREGKHFKDNLQALERMLVSFIDALKEKVMSIGEGEPSQLTVKIRGTQAPSKKTKKRHIQRGATDGNSVKELDANQSQDDKRQTLSSPLQVMKLLEGEVFPSINLLKWTNEIRFQRDNRRYVHSHELEMRAIIQVNDYIRNKFKQILRKATITEFDKTQKRENFTAHIRFVDVAAKGCHIYTSNFHEMFNQFMEGIRNTLESSCKVVAELAIEELDSVGIYSGDLNKVAELSCNNRQEADQKQEALIMFFQSKYSELLENAFDILKEKGCTKLTQDVASAIEKEFAELSYRPNVVGDVARLRAEKDVKGERWSKSEFEQIGEQIDALIVLTEQEINKKIEASRQDYEGQKKVELEKISEILKTL